MCILSCHQVKYISVNLAFVCACMYVHVLPLVCFHFALIKLSLAFMCLTTFSQWGPLAVCFAACWLICHSPTGAACYTHCCLQCLTGIQDTKVNICYISVNISSYCFPQCSFFLSAMCACVGGVKVSIRI